MEQNTLSLFNDIEQVQEKISYSRVFLFQQCQLRYKLHYKEGRPHKKQNLFYLNVGRNVHETLNRFFSSANNVRSKAALLDILNNKWNAQQFKDEEESDEWLKESERMLTRFFNDDELNYTPSLLEASFKTAIDNVMLTGKMDRVDKLKNGKFEIIDYKIGERDTKIQASDLKKDFQWVFYWLGLKNKYHLEPSKITFYYLAAGKRFSFDPRTDEVNSSVDNLKQIIKEMRSTKKFSAKPNRECMSCLFRSTCS